MGWAFFAIISFEPRAGDGISLRKLKQAWAGWHKTCFEQGESSATRCSGKRNQVQQGPSMRYLQDTGEMQAAQPPPGRQRMAAVAAVRGKSLPPGPASTGLCVYRFIHGNDTATLQSRKLTCRQSQI
jgi:hypothetical protein